MSIQTERFGEIADAIRSYTGETGGIAPNSFAEKIGDVFRAGQQSGEQWEEILDYTPTETISTEFQYPFAKRYKKIMFLLYLQGTGSDTMRFRRAKADSTFPTALNYLKVSANLSTARLLRGVVYFLPDGHIAVDGALSTSYASYGSLNTPAGDGTYNEDKRYFEEFYMYLGTNTLSTNSSIKIWGIPE